MRFGALACALVAVSGLPAMAAEPPPETWAETVGHWTYKAGKGVNVLLDKAGLPNGMKPEDGGKSKPPVATFQAPSSPTPETKGSTLGEMAYGAGLGAARAADWAYGYAYRGAAASAPYAGQALDASRYYGRKAWEGSVAGVEASAPYAAMAWSATREAGKAAWTSSLSGMDALGPYAGQALALANAAGSRAWTPAGDGAQASLVYMPVALDWATDAAAAGLTTFVATGGTHFACGVLVTPLAAVTAGTAYLICAPVSALGAYAGMQALRNVYDRMGRAPSESAFFIGSLAGGVTGGAMGQKALTSYTRWSLQSQYANYADYSTQARRLTRINLKAWGPEVGLKRAAGFHVDHVVSLKCAWTQGIPLVVAASTRNLQYLTAHENLSLGAKGC